MKARLAWLPPLLALALAACGGSGGYVEEDFRSGAVYQHEFSTAAAEPLCAAARRVLQGQGYVLGEDGKNGGHVASKEFVPEDADEDAGTVTIVQMHFDCHPRSRGATLYATATEERFDVKTQSSHAGFSLPLIAPFSLVTTSRSIQPVKTAGKTITDEDYYARFYKAVQHELDRGSTQP